MPLIFTRKCVTKVLLQKISQQYLSIWRPAQRRIESSHTFIAETRCETEESLSDQIHTFSMENAQSSKSRASMTITTVPNKDLKNTRVEDSYVCFTETNNVDEESLSNPTYTSSPESAHGSSHEDWETNLEEVEKCLGKYKKRTLWTNLEKSLTRTAFEDDLQEQEYKRFQTSTCAIDQAMDKRRTGQNMENPLYLFLLKFIIVNIAVIKLPGYLLWVDI